MQRLFFRRILALSILFFTAIAIATSSSLNSAVVAQEAGIAIFVPPPKKPASPSLKPSIPKPIKPSAVASPPTFATNHTNRVLTPSERDKITNYLRSRNISLAPKITAPLDTRFIIHDTSVIMSSTSLNRERQLGRGPLGLGVNIFLPKIDAPVIARPNFYELRRPTTTEFEKASDILPKPERERLLRQVWRATNSDGRRQSLDTALANLGLSDSEIANEQAGAIKMLSATSGRIFTTATWTIEAICTRYNSGDRSIITENTEDIFTSACGVLTNYFSIRNSRVRSSVTTEIVQAGARSSSGNQNTCDPRNSNIAPFSDPPYSENQYESALALYLRSTLAADKFPETTTHFALDAFDPAGHCDPRCFNLTKLYQDTAQVMGHAVGSTYGIEPSYGTRPGTNNIWWDDQICHGSAPRGALF